MFSNRKIASLREQVNSLTDTQTKAPVRSSAPLVTVKITGVSKVENVYYYSWQGANSDGSYNSAIGKSTDTSKAIASNEIGKTVSSPTFQTGDVVMLRKGARGLVLIGGGGGGGGTGAESPVSAITSEQWLRSDTEGALKFIMLEDANYSSEDDVFTISYRDVYIDTLGCIFKISEQKIKTVFRSTLH